MENKIKGLPSNITSQVVDALLHLPQDKELEVTIKDVVKKRSLNANAYYWVLADKIAKALTKKGNVVTATDVYKNHIREIGSYEMVCMTEDAVNDFKAMWESAGQGNQVEVMGATKEHKNYQWLKVYKGSSQYNKKEMERLIELCIQDAQNLDIDTITPNEKANLISLWGNK